MNTQCDKCMFYEPNKDAHGQTGFCLRYPPQVFPVPVAGVVGSQPKLMIQAFRTPVAGGEWCGEFKAEYDYKD